MEVPGGGGVGTAGVCIVPGKPISSVEPAAGSVDIPAVVVPGNVVVALCAAGVGNLGTAGVIADSAPAGRLATEPGTGVSDGEGSICTGVGVTGASDGRFGTG